MGANAQLAVASVDSGLRLIGAPALAGCAAADLKIIIRGAGRRVTSWAARSQRYSSSC
jgi:hypothetical protein